MCWFLVCWWFFLVVFLIFFLSLNVLWLKHNLFFLRTDPRIQSDFELSSKNENVSLLDSLKVWAVKVKKMKRYRTSAVCSWIINAKNVLILVFPTEHCLNICYEQNPLTTVARIPDFKFSNSPLLIHCRYAEDLTVAVCCDVLLILTGRKSW